MVPRSDFSLDKARRELGNGPLRFAAEGERSTEEQIAALTVAEKKCFDSLKSKWEEKHSPFSDDMYLRFARCSPGKEKFNEKASMRVMKQYDKRYLRLTAADLEEQLLSKTLFPLPGLTSKEGNEIFYMRPSRYFPKKTSTETVIDNLAYCMNTMVEKEHACSDGIGFLAYST